MKGPLLLFALMAIFPFCVLAFIVVLASYGAPVYIFGPLVPVYALAFYWSWGKAKELVNQKKFKNLVALLFILLIALATPISAFVLTRTSWNFKVTTDKSNYTVGETVNITVTLTNNAYLPQQITVAAIQFHIYGTNTYNAYSTYAISGWNVSLGYRQSLQKTFTWQAADQVGQYTVVAYAMPLVVNSEYSLFSSSTEIIVTS